MPNGLRIFRTSQIQRQIEIVVGHESEPQMGLFGVQKAGIFGSKFKKKNFKIPFSPSRRNEPFYKNHKFILKYLALRTRLKII
jgi:hypothetical protein